MFRLFGFIIMPEDELRWTFMMAQDKCAQKFYQSGRQAGIADYEI